MNQIMPLLSLYSDFIVCLLAASVLSLFAGWMMHRTRTEKQLRSMNESWTKRYNTLEDISQIDTDTLEERLQSLAKDSRALLVDKKLLTESLKLSERSIQKFRTETIELNRQHAEIQERLQRIIQQKDQELLELGNRLNHPRTSSHPGATEKLLSQESSSDSSELTYADTVAINSIDMLDATLQIPTEDDFGKQDRNASNWKPGLSTPLATELGSDTTQALDMEETTVALDEDALAFARRPNKTGRAN